MKMPPLYATPAAGRRRAVLAAVQHQRTTRAALNILRACGVGVRVERMSTVSDTSTRVHFGCGATGGVWTDWRVHPGHSVVIESMPLRMVPTLLKAVPDKIDQESVAYEQPSDFQGPAARYLRERCGGLLAGWRWSPLPGAEDEYDPPQFTQQFRAHWLGVTTGNVKISGPGMDATAEVEVHYLTERRAHCLMEAYATLIAPPTG